ncbi:MAG TPA: PAS domain S-box protein [Parafilimonas sp.]|nr:PAS domain S-box protein [Parafilimonas sp.]
MDTSGFFETFFNNAKYNGIFIMNTDGNIISINEAFHLRFGYSHDELVGKNFSVLFTEKDRSIKRPERELQNVLAEGSANDENYLLHRDGNKLWVTGESVLIKNDDDSTYIVKVVHNIHAQKQLERFLLQSHEFIDSIFDSITESALLMLDSSLKVLKANHAFIEMFNLKHPPVEGSRLSDIDNEFWQRADVKQEIVNFITSGDNNKGKIFKIEEQNGEIRTIRLHGKVLEGTKTIEKKLLIMIKA